MDRERNWIPSGSQTVGPYFRIGLEYLIDLTAETDLAVKNAIEIRGRVLDRDRVPVPDAMLEFWCPGGSPTSQGNRIPHGFRRVATDPEGCYAVRIGRPSPSLLEDGRMQAPHIMVLVFARGLLRHLTSRLYLEDVTANKTDPVLLGIPPERRGTLMAKVQGADAYRWDVILQGDDETVFFAW